jgi:hypothetical protein
MGEVAWSEANKRVGVLVVKSNYRCGVTLVSDDSHEETLRAAQSFQNDG